MGRRVLGVGRGRPAFLAFRPPDIRTASWLLPRAKVASSQGGLKGSGLLLGDVPTDVRLSVCRAYKVTESRIFGLVND